MNDPHRLAPLDLVLDSSHDFIGMADATGVVTYLNRAARAMTRLPLEGPLPPLSILDFVPGQLRDMFATIVEPALRESGHWRGREALRSPVDGQQIPIEIDVFSLGRSRDGRLSGLMTVIHEISSPRESQVAAQRNEAALQVARMGHWEFDVAERQFEFNDLYYALHGLTAEQAGGYLMSAETFTARYVHPEDAHLVTQAIQAAAESSDPDFQFQREARILRADGTTRNVMVWFRVEKDPRGRTVRLHGVNQDITERKQVEEALRKSEFFLQKSQSVAHVGSYWFWPSTGTWICSPALDEIFGIDATYRKDIDGWMGIVHPDHRAEMLDHLLKHVLAGRNRFDHEYRIVRPSDGRVLWVHGLGELELDATGAPTAMIGTIQDITERRRADDALKESEERFRTTLYSIADGVVTTDVSGRIRQMNRVAEALTGWKEPDALGRPVDEVVQFVDEAGAKSSAWPAARALPGQPSAERSANLYLVSRDGSRRPISESAAPIRTGSGDVTGAVLVFSDQTLVRALQGQLLHAQKMEAIGRLAGGIAHDFNNMLGVVLGHASQIAERVGPDSPLFEDLQAIVEAAERSANLTRQLLGFARQQVVEPRTLNLNEEVSSLARMLQRLIGEDITLRLDLDAELWPVWIDPTQVDQVLANLATNARDAIGSIGSITISTRNVPAPHAPASTATGIPAGDHVMLSFSDTGAGMDAQTLQRVFEPFFTTKPIGKGTGLGLATVFGIVNQNHGTVSVSSEPGVGTTFRVALPRAPGPAPAAGEEAVRDMPRGTETLLVVEDEPALLRIVTRTLEQCGYTVLGAGTPSRALDFTDEQITAADLLITDVIMPGMNGFDLLERLRARAPGLRALFMSGYTAEVVAERGAALDGATFIAKPFKRFELARKVREMLDGAG